MGDKRINRRHFLGAAAALSGSVMAGSHRRRSVAAPLRAEASLSMALSESLVARVQPLLDQYTKRTGTTINVITSRDADFYTHVMIALTQATGAYDVVALDDIWIPQFAASGALIDLQPLLNDAGVPVDLDILPGMRALGQGTGPDQLFGMPWIGTLQMLAWRTDLLAALGVELPTTWHGLTELAALITAEYGERSIYGAGLCGRPGEPAAMSFLPILRGHGIDILDPVTSEPLLTTGPAYSAMSVYLDLCQQAAPGVERTGPDELGIGLYTGGIALSPDIWPEQLIKVNDPRISRVMGTVAVGPQRSIAGQPGATINAGWLLGIPTDAADPARAFDLVKWMTEAKQQKTLLLDQGVFGTRTSVLTDEEAIKRYPFLPEMVAAATTTAPRPRSPYAQAMLLSIGRHAANAVTGAITGPEALGLANTEIRTLLVREGVLPADA